MIAMMIIMMCDNDNDADDCDGDDDVFLMTMMMMMIRVMIRMLTAVFLIYLYFLESQLNINNKSDLIIKISSDCHGDKIRFKFVVICE